MTITGHIVLIDAKPGADFERDNPPVTYHIHPSKIQRVYQLPGDPWWRLVLDAKYAIITRDEPRELLEFIDGKPKRSPELMELFSRNHP